MFADIGAFLGKITNTTRKNASAPGPTSVRWVNQNGGNNSDPKPKEVLDAINRVEKKIDVLGTQSQATYAVAARRGASAPPAASTRMATSSQMQAGCQLPPQRELRSIVVQVKNPEEAAGVRRIARTELLNRIKATGSKTTKDIVEICWISSGNFLIGTGMEAAKRLLEEDKRWLQALANSAKIKKKIFTVMAHRIWVTGVETQHQTKAIKQIKQQN